MGSGSADPGTVHLSRTAARIQRQGGLPGGLEFEGLAFTVRLYGGGDGERGEPRMRAKKTLVKNILTQSVTFATSEIWDQLWSVMMRGLRTRHGIGSLTGSALQRD
ncbi:hypothetical protein AOLI_G00027140 [Acnodon oligacanthus]